jgi:hypothetical protein
LKVGEVGDDTLAKLAEKQLINGVHQHRYPIFNQLAAGLGGEVGEGDGHELRAVRVGGTTQAAECLLHFRARHRVSGRPGRGTHAASAGLRILSRAEGSFDIRHRPTSTRLYVITTERDHY